MGSATSDRVLTGKLNKRIGKLPKPPFRDPSVKWKQLNVTANTTAVSA